MLRSLVLATGLLAVGGALPVTAEAAECSPYGATVTLAGRYADGVVAISPTGDIDPRGIAGRTANLLILDAPLCVETDSVSRGVAAAMDIQLRCPELVLVGGEAALITGRLVGAHTGNGHTPVLLVCNP
jgi:hypothetical protein